MVSIYSVKPYFQRVLKPLLLLLVRLGVTPNQVTLFATFLSVSFGIYFTWEGPSSWWLMPLVLLVRMALNAIDGMMARQFQLQSRFGTYLNELGDIVSDLFLCLPFMMLFPWSVGSVCFLSLLSEVAGILATAVGQTRRYDGPMGKSDRAFCLGILGFLMAFGWISSSWVVILLGIISLLLCLTIYFRIKNALVNNAN